MVLVLAVSPSAVLVVRQQATSPGDLDEIGEQAGGDGLRVDRAEGGNARGGYQGLQPVPPERHGGTILDSQTIVNPPVR